MGVIDRNGNGENRGVARAVVIRGGHEAGCHLIEQEDFVKDGMDYSLVLAQNSVGAKDRPWTDCHDRIWGPRKGRSGSP